MFWWVNKRYTSTYVCLIRDYSFVHLFMLPIFLESYLFRVHLYLCYANVLKYVEIKNASPACLIISHPQTSSAGERSMLPLNRQSLSQVVCVYFIVGQSHLFLFTFVLCKNNLNKRLQASVGFELGQSEQNASMLTTRPPPRPRSYFLSQ